MNDAVRQRQRHGWVTVLGGFGALASFTFDRGPRGVYQLLDLYVGDRRIEVTVSPTGRSVQVFVDGVKVQ